jgi:hypothetical protein
MTPSVPIIYSNEWLYHALMRVLYGRYFEARYRALAAEIPERASIVDLCAGDCYLYRKYLRTKLVRYVGLDLSPAFVRAAQKNGVQARVFDVWQDEIPRADLVVMQASLYQFLPHAEEIVAKMLAAARKKVIIAEPVRNLSSSRLSWLAKFSRLLTTPQNNEGPCSTTARFDEMSLSEVFKSFPAFQRSFFIPGRREMVGIFRGSSI